MLTPTPMLRPSPLDISGLFAGTFEALKRRFGLFVLITLFPVALGAVLIIVGLVTLVSSAVIAGSGNTGSLPVGLLIGMVFYLLGILAVGLGQLKSYAMMAVAAYEIAQGQHPDFRGLLTRTRGFLPRMAPVIAIAIGAGVVLFGSFFALMAGSIGSIATIGPRGRGSAAVAGLFGALALFIVVLIPATYYLRTKLLYTIPATAIENVGGIDGMKRSWRLTSGAFWRTLGYYLVASIAVSVITSMVTGVGQFAMMPVIAATAPGANSSDPGAALAAFGALIPAVVIMVILGTALEIVAVPFLQTYGAYMYLDQVRRSEMPATPFGYPPMQPGYGYAPGPQGPYAPPPGPQYPQPGQGYPPPGQYYAPPGQYPAQPGHQTGPPPPWPGNQGQQPPPGQNPS